MLRLSHGMATHPGRRRHRNEDAALVGSHLFAVADGMGGHAAGDVASAIAIDHLRDLAHRADLDRGTVLDRVREADHEIRAHDAGTAAGMGTTICGFAYLGSGSRRILVFNVGDSRVYRLSDGELGQITHDHSVVQELLDSKAISHQESLDHPDRHVITRSLGAGDPLDIDWWHIAPRPGDRYLVTSDGLTKEVGVELIARILDRDTPPEVTAGALVDEALQAGGRDNITVVIVDVLTVEAADGADPLDPLDRDTSERADALVGAGADTTPTATRPPAAPDPEIVATVEATPRP